MLCVEDRHQVSEWSIHPRLAYQHEVAPMESGIGGSADDQVISGDLDDAALQAKEHQVGAVPEGRELHRSAARH